MDDSDKTLDTDSQETKGVSAAGAVPAAVCIQTQNPGRYRTVSCSASLVAQRGGRMRMDMEGRIGVESMPQECGIRT